MTKQSFSQVFHRKLITISFVISLSSFFWVPVSIAQDTSETELCLLQHLKDAKAEMTVGEIRALCVEQNAEESIVVSEASGGAQAVGGGSASQRMAADRKAIVSPYSILAHKPNYFLFGAYNSKGWDSTLFREASNNPDYKNQDVEGQFQISLKVPLALDLFGDRVDIYGAYTNRSFWQMYNRSNSEPFRETNHEPEVWLQFENDWQVLGLTNVVNTAGFVHQSNGRSGNQSRSWNRLYANFIFEKDNFVLSFKPWVWITKDKTTSDNPDITDYLGHGEIRAAWQHKGHVVSFMSRNNLESGFDRGAVELGWSFPVFDYPYLKGYMQYFYGYGESLIDYDNRVNRIGIGISVTDWLQ